MGAGVEGGPPVVHPVNRSNATAPNGSPQLFMPEHYRTSRRRQRLGDHDAPSSAGLLGFDDLFHPSAHNARVIWEPEQVIPVPAPTPDKGPGVIEAGSRITIDVGKIDGAGK